MRPSRRSRLGVVLALVAISLSAEACGGAHAPGARPAPPPSRERPDAGPPGAPDFAHRIDDPETWHALAARPASHTVARSEVVKFLIDLRDERRLWLTQTERFDIHYFFARRYLSGGDQPLEDHATFNVREYRHDDRRFVMGSIVHYLDTDLWTFELIAGDTLRAEPLLQAFEQVKAATYFGPSLRFRPTAELHQARVGELGGRLPSVAFDAPYAGARYQPLTTGVSFGILRVVRGAFDPTSVRPNEVIVVAHVPEEIPVASGLITGTFQAPLAHVAVLSAGRGTPNMALRDATNAPEIVALDGRLVRLEVGPQDFRISAATQVEAEADWQRRRPTAVITPRVDVGPRSLRDVCTLTLPDAAAYGAKAASLGEVCSVLSGAHVPAGFGIPVHFYADHLRRHHIDAELRAMLDDGTIRLDRAQRAPALDGLRAIIRRLPVDPALVREVRARMGRLGAGPVRTIFRSSASAEDQAGFSGAGLYRSVIVEAQATEAQIEDAIREVWASVWLNGAFEEREWYRVDHSQVAMGILVQVFVGDVMATGVAITRNPFFEGRPGVFINAQAQGGSVTDARDEVPEQFLVYTYNAEPEIEVLSRSTRTQGRALLEARDVRTLTELLTRLDAHFTPRYAPRANAVDVEFLVTAPGHEVLILQARPYNVVYGEGQR